jgi:hypothetical protein
MTTLYVTGVPQMLFGLGIPNVIVHEVVLVKPVPDEKRQGVRPFSEVQILTESICSQLNFEYKFLELHEFQAVSSRILKNDVVDLQILSKLGRVELPNSPHILACQVEHVNLTRPSVFNFGRFRSLVKRFDLTYKLLFPNRIRTFYTLAPKRSGWPILREKQLEYKKIMDNCVRIANSLEQKEEYKFLGDFSRNLYDSKVMVVLPKAQHFGGDETFNELMFRELASLVKEMEVEKVLIKNHPSDESDYLELAKKFFSEDQIETLADLRSRSLPLEILSARMNRFFIAGVESTSSLALRHSVCHPTIIFDTKEHNGSKHQKYDSGEIREQYLHKLILL